MVKKPHIFFALPIMEESMNINKLLKCLDSQEYKNFTLVVCVNQYESYWDDEKYTNICIDNAKCLDTLRLHKNLNIRIVDRSSKGKGWKQKKGGVGWARKVIMDEISGIGNKDDIIISIDADTNYPEEYALNILNYFIDNPKSYGLAVPYFHPLGNDETDTLILRYEIYMRYYLLNMMRADNPYCFTAIGSAMAFPIWAYRKVGGLTPVVSGEDFYFLQKLNKSGPIGLWVDTIAYPSPRYSSRVVFGTGPALIKGKSGDWSSYPIYNPVFFDEVNETFNLFERLYTEDVITPMDNYFKDWFGNTSWYHPLRLNFKDRTNFVRACISKVDGLRILQYLRYRCNSRKKTDLRNLFVYLNQFLSNKIEAELTGSNEQTDFHMLSVDTLKKVRDELFKIEMRDRKTRFLTYHINYA